MKDRKEYVKKTCNYCYDCNRNYPLDIQFCKKCGAKMFPVPYTPLGVKRGSF